MAGITNRKKKLICGNIARIRLSGIDVAGGVGVSASPAKGVSSWIVCVTEANGAIPTNLSGGTLQVVRRGGRAGTAAADLVLQLRGEAGAAQSPG